MPQGQQYTVQFPDGYKTTFMAAPGMTDDQLITRAKQERDVSAGRIQTTFTGGGLKAIGEDERTTGALLNGVGMIPGLTPIGMLSAPIARGIRYGTEKLTGQNPSLPDTAELAGLAGKTAIGMIPLAVNKGLTGAAEKAVAREIAPATPGTTAPAVSANSYFNAPIASAGTPAKWAAGIKGSGVIPWAAREGLQAAGNLSKNYIQPWAAYTPAIRDAILNLLSPQPQPQGPPQP